MKASRTVVANAGLASIEFSRVCRLGMPGEQLRNVVP